MADTKPQPGQKDKLHLKRQLYTTPPPNLTLVASGTSLPHFCYSVSLVHTNNPLIPKYLDLNSPNLC